MTPRGPSEERGVFIGSGGFGVDSRRAVAVLRERQLALESEDAALAWVRLAAHAGATRAVLAWESGGFELRFDGAPLPAVLLSRPYDAYLGSMDADALMRQFGLALLHLARPGVDIALTAGPARARRAVYFRGPAADPPVAVEDGRDDTVVKAVWQPPAKPRKGHPETWDLHALADRLDACPMPVTLVHRGKTRVIQTWSRRFGREAWVSEADGLRCGVHIFAECERGTSLQLCLAGVSVERERLDGLPVPADAWVDSLEFRLNASLTRVVKGPPRERARHAGMAALAEAFPAALARHGKLMKLSAALLKRKPSLIAHWERAMDAGFRDTGRGARARRKSEMGFFRRPSSDVFLLEDAALWTVAWRRALRLAQDEKIAPAFSAFCDALPSAPLAFTRDFDLVSPDSGLRAVPWSQADAKYLNLRKKRA